MGKYSFGKARGPRIALRSIRATAAASGWDARLKHAMTERGGGMSKLEQIESQISSLSAEELARFREWFAEFDAEAWDRQIERDLAAGKFDDLIAEAKRT